MKKGLEPSIIGEPVDLFATCLEILPERYSHLFQIRCTVLRLLSVLLMALAPAGLLTVPNNLR